MAEVSQRFASLFSCNARGHGVFNPREKDNKKKHFLVHRAVSDQDWADHLAGKFGLGLAPILDDSTCWWGAIDLDAHKPEDTPFDPMKMERKIKELGLPLIVCRSKSGRGVHLYLFLSAPAQAALVMARLGDWKLKLGGAPNTEVYPKQSRIEIDVKGNMTDPGWINLPYFDVENTARFAVIGGKQASLDKFLQEAEDIRVHPNQLMQLAGGPSLEDAPPCLQHLIGVGVDGYRNEFVYNLTVYAKKAYPDNVKDTVHELVARSVNRAMSFTTKEVDRTITSAMRRDYKYKCSQEPIKSVCKRDICLTRKFGITDRDVPSLRSLGIERIIREMGDPVIWRLDFYGGATTLIDGDVLFHYHKLERVIFDKTLITVPSIDQDMWKMLLEQAAGDIITRDIPEDASLPGRTAALVVAWLRERIDWSRDPLDTSQRSLLKLGNPVFQQHNGEDVVMFRADDAINYLKSKRADELRGTAFYIALRDRLQADNDHISCGGKSKVRVWFVPVDYVRDEEGDHELKDPEFKSEF